jgi:membrane-bound serine protease (ClpP class)
MCSKSNLYYFLLPLLFFIGYLNIWAEGNSSETSGTKTLKLDNDEIRPILAYQIPIREQIGSPILDILRRGLKDAIREEADTVILDMDTPGGELGVTLEIMEEIIENLEKFKGNIITYVNDEAISAGAYIAIASSEIAFSPKSQIGAAEAVSGGGANIDSSMKRKINSYLKAKIRNYAGKHRYRSQIMSAMMDANESLIIEGEPLRTDSGSLIKKPGELLTLTGKEACESYGSPPLPLLGIGVYESVDEILDDRWGKGTWELKKMEINWAEEAGIWLNGIAPIILSIGLVCIFVEFKTPGFGIFGVVGLILLLVFFGSKYVAGLAGQEELLVFLVGACLVLVEIFLVPGLILPGILGIALMVGSIFWAMVDVWPTPDFQWNMEIIRAPLWEMLQTLALVFLLGFFISKFLPKTSLWKSLVLSASLDGPNSSENNVRESELINNLAGKRGMSVSELYPCGQVEINGTRYEARSNLGKISKGENVEVVKNSEFELVVERVDL